MTSLIEELIIVYEIGIIKIEGFKLIANFGASATLGTTQVYPQR
jgi:hypothetical protein